jgi:two-component system, NarL family, sensor kinase
VKNFTVRRVLRFIGPYPYNPYLIFLFFWSIVLSRLLPLVTDQPSGTARWSAAGVVFLLSFIPPLLFAIAAYTLQKARNRRTPSLPRYIIEVAIGQSLGFVYAPFLHSTLESRYGYNFQTLSTINLRVFLGSLIFVLLALALMHQAERKIIERLTAANDLVVKLQAEREDLVHSDEKLRRHTSQFLHDRVQSDLMVVGIKLKSISGKSSPEVNEVIDRAILRLENTRASDLKNLIQILTPNLESGTLSSALEILLEQNQSNVGVSLKIDSETETLDSSVLLGIFRIVEQALLNSLVHGPAKRVQVSVSTDSAGVTELIVSDDGPGVRIEGVSAGVGTAIIDSWVGILNGSKEIDSVPGHGYQLHVTFIAVNL